MPVPQGFTVEQPATRPSQGNLPPGFQLETASAPAPARPVGGNLRPMTEQEQLTTTYPMGERGESLGENTTNALRNILTGAYGVIRHPINTLTGMLSSVIPGTSTPNPIQSLYQGLNTRPGETLTTGLGQAAILGPAGKVAADVAPASLESAGEGLRSTGGKISDVTALGSNALDRRFGASPGRALSEQRIVGMSKPSLKAKVDASLPPIAEARDSVLRASTAGPQNVREVVDQPFRTLHAQITDPRTGVAAPLAQQISVFAEGYRANIAIRNAV